MRVADRWRDGLLLLDLLPHLLLFIPPSSRTLYFSIQKLSLASITKGSVLRTFSNGRKLKWARSWPGRLKWSPTPVSQWWVTAPLCSVHLCLNGLVWPTLPTYWAGFLWQAPYMLSSSTTNAIIQSHPGDPEWSKYSSCYPPMISTIFNELIVQIVSDFFPKPKAPPGVTMSITVHKPSPSFSFLPFSDFNYRAQNKYKFHRHFVPSFYPSLPSSKHKHKFNRHFYSFLLSKPAFKQTQTQI